MAQGFMTRIIRPLVVPLGVAIVAGALIIGIGEILLNLFEHGKPELERMELWFAVGLSLVILFGCGFLATRPAGATGLLDREVAIGDKPMFGPNLPPVDLAARRGPEGTVADIGPGYTLYARSGALARVVEVLSGIEEQGKMRRGLIYAQGLFGANDDLWIPVEAVAAVYPETRSAFLAIRGDEVEALGWHRAPASFSRQPRRPGPHSA
ncbi:MAG TPA: hypothetical protein VIL01_01935 [Thermomicrobiales bacterium]